MQVSAFIQARPVFGHSPIVFTDTNRFIEPYLGWATNLNDRELTTKCLN